MTERTIFLAALDIADPAERSAYLGKACAGDPALRAQVEGLLAAHERPGDFLDVPAAAQGVAPAQPPGTQTAPPAAPPGPGETQAEDSAGGHADLPPLAPSQRPAALGRLGHYEVLEVVGKGGMGVVLRAFDAKLHRVVAIKALAPALASSGTARQRFVREARAAAAVTHDNVIAIHAVEDTGPVPYLVMQFIDGCTLQDKLHRTGPLQLREVLRIGLQIAEGLAGAHKQGLIHRDVKPANILLENSIERVKLTDFGLARAADDASLTQSGLIAGTPQYMSPEQAQGLPVDHRSDLFSLGSVLYAMCTGRPPFRAESTLAVLKRVCEDTPRPIREVNPDIPDWLAAIVAKLHAKEPARRFQTAQEVAELLGKHLAHLQQPGLAPRPAAVEVPGRARRGRAPLLAAALLLAAVGALTTYLVLRPGRPAAVVPESGGPKQEQRGKPFVPRPPLTAGELAKLPNPLDGRKRGDIPPALLALAGGGDPALAPPELVAVLGDSRFRLFGQLIGGPECSPDGRLLAVPSGLKVLLFEARTGRLRKVLEVPGKPWRVAAFSPNGSRLLTANYNGEAELWEIGSGKRVQAFRGHADAVVQALFGPGDRTVITGGVDRTVRVWDLTSGEQKALLPHGDHVHAAAVSPDGKRLVTGCNDRAVRVWDLASGALKQTLSGHTEAVHTVRFSPDGKLLATGTNNELKLWNADTFAKVRTLPVAASWFRFTPDGSTVVCAKTRYGDDEYHAVTRWDVNTGEKRAELPLLSRGGWAAFALSPDGKRLFNARSGTPPDDFLRAYDAETGKDLFPHQGHTGPVNTVAISPDGRTLASGGADHTVRLWDLATGRQTHALARHTELVWSVAFSPDGRLLASSSPDNTVVLWDAATGREVRTLPGRSHLLAFSPDGRALAAGAEDGRVRLWDVAGGKPKEPLRLHAGFVWAVAFSPDGRWLASCGNDGTVPLCEADTGRRVHTFRTGTPITNVAFTPDSRTLACSCASPGAPLRLWDLASRQEVALPGHANFVCGLAIHPGGRMLATGAHDGTVRFCDRTDRSAAIFQMGPGPFGGQVHQVAFSPEGRYLAAANDNGTVSILRVPAPPPAYTPGPPRKLPDPVDLARRRAPADALKHEDIPPGLLAKVGGPDKPLAELVAVLGDARLRHDDCAVASFFLAGGETLLSVGRDNRARFWDLKTGRQRQMFEGPKTAERVHAAALSPDGKVLAWGTGRRAGGVWGDGTLKLLDAATGEELRTIKSPGRCVMAVTFSPDGKTLATGCTHDGDGHVRLWEVATGKAMGALGPGPHNAHRIAFRRDGKAVAACYATGDAQVFDLSRPEKPIPLPFREVISLAYLPDGKALAAARGDGTVIRWEPDTGKQRTILRGLKPDSVAPPTASRDGALLAAAGGDGVIKLAEVAKGRELRALNGPGGSPVWSLAFSRDSKTLASTHNDGRVRLWDVTTGKERFPTQGHAGQVWSVAVSPDGKRLASAGEDGTVRVRDLSSGKQLHVFTRPGVAYSVAFGPDGKTLAAVWRPDKAPVLFDVVSGAEVRTLAGGGDFCQVAFSPDGKLLAAGAGVDGLVRVWDVASGGLVRTFTGHQGGVSGVAFSPDGTTLASGGLDTSVRLWDLRSGWHLALLGHHGGQARHVAFHPDGRTLASSGNDGTVRLWDLAKRELAHTLTGPGGISVNAAWSADGRLLCSFAHSRGEVRVWDVTDPTRYKPFQLLPGMHGVALTPEGRHLATANPDGTVSVLRLARRGEVFRVPAAAR